MSNLTDRLHAQARITPISQPNKVKMVTKLADGGLQIEFNSGAIGVLSKDDPMIQAFVVYTMLADL